QSSDVVPPLLQDALRPAPARDRARRLGRAAADHRHRLPQGVCHASFSTIRKFVRDVIGLTISRGQLAKIIGKVSRALERPYEELLGHLPDQDFLNVDETGHRQNRQRQWIWCLPAELYTASKIRPTRSGDVVIE